MGRQEEDAPSFLLNYQKVNITKLVFPGHLSPSIKIVHRNQESRLKQFK